MRWHRRERRLKVAIRSPHFCFDKIHDKWNPRVSHVWRNVLSVSWTCNLHSINSTRLGTHWLQISASSFILEFLRMSKHLAFMHSRLPQHKSCLLLCCVNTQNATKTISSALIPETPASLPLRLMKCNVGELLRIEISNALVLVLSRIDSWPMQIRMKGTRRNT